MATGRVLQFDPVRGYGFIAAEDGGEDIFLHASVFDGDADALVPGIRVEFQIMSGDRGRKAFKAHPAANPTPPPSPVSPPGPTPPPSIPPPPVPAPSSSTPPPPGPVPPPSTTPPAVPVPGPPTAQNRRQATRDPRSPADSPPPGHPTDDEQLRDVLSPSTFVREITELLLTATPDLTGSQILNVRNTLLEFAKKHGWSDG